MNRVELWNRNSGQNQLEDNDGKFLVNKHWNKRGIGKYSEFENHKQITLE